MNVEMMLKGMLLSDMSKTTLQNLIIHLSKKQEECDKYSLGDYYIAEKTAKEWLILLREHWASRD